MLLAADKGLQHYPLIFQLYSPSSPNLSRNYCHLFTPTKEKKKKNKKKNKKSTSPLPIGHFPKYTSFSEQATRSY